MFPNNGCDRACGCAEENEGENVLKAVLPALAVAVFVSMKLPVRPNDPIWPDDPGLAVPNIDGGAAAGTPKSPAPLFWNGLAIPLMPPPPVKYKIL